MKKSILFLTGILCAILSQGQTSIQNFGTGTGSQTSQTGSTAFIPNPTSGTTWARGGATAPNAPVVLANTGNPLGTTGSFVRGVASATTSVAKFSPWVGYTGGTEFYTSFKILFGDAAGGNTAASGIWNFYQGAGAMYSDASDFAGSQVFTGLRFTFATGGNINLTYRAGSNFVTTGLTQTTFNSATVYTVEIVGNNKTSGSINYLYAGVAQSVAVQKFDLYINGTLIGDDLAEALLPANTSINSGTFIGISSTANVANVFVDDATTYNAVPASIGVPPTPTTTSLSPNSGVEGGSSFTLTVNGTNFFNTLSTVRWNGSNRTTTYVSNTQLTATINAADIAAAGTASVDVSTTGAAAVSNAQTFTINSAVTPLITLSPASLSGFTYVAGAGPSGVQSFSVSGANLQSAPGNIAVTAPADYEINDGNGWSSSFNIPYASATLNPVNIDVRLKAGLAVGNYNGEQITVSGGGDIKTETLNGQVTLGNPVANAPTVFTAYSFTANWAAVSGATAGYLLDASANSSFTAPGTISSEGFENTLTLFTETSGAGSFSTGNSAAIDGPPNSPFAVNGSFGYGKSNGSVSISSADINTSAATGVQLSFRLASFSLTGTANGADAGDIVTVEISPDGGTTYYNTLRILGNSNAYWAYSATGIASTAYDANGTPVDFQPASGGPRTADGYSTISITGLPSVAALKVRITLLNNNANELWLIDDLTVTGTVASYLTGYDNLAVPGTSQVITVPGPGTYYYRLRATTGAVTSANSNSVSVIMNSQDNAGFRSVASGDYSAAGSWEFNVSPPAYFASATQGPGISNHVMVQNGHTLTLTTNASANDLLLSTNGNIILGNHQLTVNNISGGSASGYIQTNGTGSLVVNNISVAAKTLPVGLSAYNPVTIANGSGHHWSARVEDAVNNVQAPFTTNKAILRTWHITPSVNPPGSGADITFQYDDSDPSQKAAGFNTSEDVQLWHYGGGWVAVSGAITPAGAPNGTRTITRTGLTGFSPFAIANISGPLPVSFLSFSGYKEGSRNQLRWTTAAEINNQGFEVQRSADGLHYTTIGFVNSTALNGNSTVAISYSFTDLTPSGSRQYYRLRQVDLGGAAKMSQVLLIRDTKPSITGIETVFPNPARDWVNLLIAAPSRNRITLVMTDISGNNLLQRSMQVESGSNSLTLPVSNLPAGTYIIKLSCDEGCKSAVRFVKY